MRISTIRLLGTNRVKVFTIGMLILIPCLLFFLHIAIMIEIPNHLELLVLSYLALGTLFLGGVYFLFNTSDKVLYAQLFIGMCFTVLSFVLFAVFSYVMSQGVMRTFIKSLVLFLPSLGLTELVLIKTQFFNFKKPGRMRDSFWLSMLGVVIGKAGYEYIKTVYGEVASNLIGMSSLLFLVVLFGFLGLFFLNKFYIARNFGNYISIEFDD